MAAFYNEHDPFAVNWLCNLAAARHLPAGLVDGRDIQEVTARDLKAYTECHFFAGIGGWPLALRLAGWPADRPVWTGSCPCQPFSQAGKGEGEEGERHLWPAFFSLIRECRPDCCFGEQVASRAGYRWLDGVRTDLESQGYAVGAADLPAACVGSPHVRQRIFWVAQRITSKRRRVRFAFDERSRVAINPDECHAITIGEGRTLYVPKLRNPSDPGCAGVWYERQPMAGAAGGDQGEEDQRQRVRGDAGDGQSVGVASDADLSGRRSGRESQRKACHVAPDGDPGRTHDPAGERADLQGAAEPEGDGANNGIPRQAGAAGYWDAFDIIHYRDGKARRVEPGTFPLAHGVPARVGRLRGYGNAIVPQVAATFIKAFLAVERGH